MSKFKVGDKVRVIDGGRHLNTDDRFMKAYAPNLLDKWRNGKYYDTMGRTQDVVGTVIAVGEIDKVLVSDAIGELFVIYEYGLSLEPIRREFIVIRRSGAETIAELRHDREVIKSAKAICNASDTFDFSAGAKLAFDRLMGRQSAIEVNTPAPAPEPKFYTGKVFAVNPKPESADDPTITIRNNRVYEFKDGFIVGNRYGIIRLREPYKSFQDFADDKWSTEWREVKEPSDVH